MIVGQWQEAKTLLDLAIRKTGVDRIKVRQRPRFLSDNGPCYISKELKEFMRERELSHIRGQPYHPMTQGKIERFHRSMKNIINLNYYYLPWDLEKEIEEFVDFYNNERYHESINNLRPVDVYNGKGVEILDRRERIKRKTMTHRRRHNLNKECVNSICI